MVEAQIKEDLHGSRARSRGEKYAIPAERRAVERDDREAERLGWPPVWSVEQLDQRQT